MKLHAIAHARAGDKGNVSDLTLIPFDERDFPRLVAEVTTDRVRSHFAPVVRGEVVRYVLPQLHALKFVLSDALGGGVTRSLALDAHGKTYSALLLDLELPVPPAVTALPDHEE